MLQLKCTGLILTPVNALDCAEGSIDVQVQIEFDNTYATHTKTLHIGYFDERGVEHGVSSSLENNVFKIPGPVFAQAGIIFISVHFSKTGDTTELETNAVQYRVQKTAGGVGSLPGSYIWEPIIKGFVNDYLESNEVKFGTDTTLTKSGKAADAKVVGEEIEQLKKDIANKETVTSYEDLTNIPTINGVQIKGAMTNETLGLSSPTDEQIANSVNEYLDEHPEATTTVQDGSITEEKLHPDLVDTLKKAKVNDENYDTQPLGTLFDRPDGWNYVTWCSNALQYDERINKYVNLAWARGGHTDESNADSQDTIYRVLINADTLLVEDISPLVMLDSDVVTDITTELMEGASFMILKDGTYVYASYLDDTSTYKAYRYTSTDYGKTWVKDDNSVGIDCPYKARELSNGRILFSNTASGKGIRYSDDKLASSTLATVTGGHGLAYGTWVSEWEFVELEENYIMAIGRKNKGGAGSEFSGDSDHALITYSTDNGTTWSQIVESTSIDNMNASNCTSIVHDGIVELFTTSRWYHNGTYTNNDYEATGKDGAMFHYVATIEEAKNDNFTNLGVVLYANGTDNSAQDFHAPCLALNTNTKDILIVYMDRIESIPNEENNNYHYVKGSLGKVCTKIDDNVESPVYTYSNKVINKKMNQQKMELQDIIDLLSSSVWSEIVTIKYALSQIEGSGIETPEVPEGATVMWTQTYNASDGVTIIDENSWVAPYVLKGTSTDTNTVMTTDSLGNAVCRLNSASILIPTTKENFAIECVQTYNASSTLRAVGLAIDDNLTMKCDYCGGATDLYIRSHDGGIAEKFYTRGSDDVVVTRRVVKNSGKVYYTCLVDGEAIVQDKDITDYDLGTVAEHTTSLSWIPSYANITQKAAFILNQSGNVFIHSIKFGEWD